MGEMTGKGLTRVVMLNNTVYEVKETPDNIRTTCRQTCSDDFIRVMDKTNQILYLKKEHITTIIEDIRVLMEAFDYELHVG